MAAASPSPLASSVEKTNGAKLSRLLIDGGTMVLRKIFDRYHPPANLLADLNANYHTLNNLLRRRVLHKPQWDLLFPPGGATPDSNTFDITLLFLLLTNICGLAPPPSGWHTKPLPSDTSVEANLARIKFFRNELYGHVTTTGINTPAFSALWVEISAVLVALGLPQAEIDKLKAEHCGEEDFLDLLFEWADSEEDIKSQLKDIRQYQAKTGQTICEVRQTQVKDWKILQDNIRKLEEVHEVQTETHQTVDEVRQTLLEYQKRIQDITVILEDILKCQSVAVTQKTIDEKRQTQLGDRKTVEDSKGYSKLQEDVEVQREKNKENEILKKLAKIETLRNVRYHADRYVEGTRLSFFSKVDRWLNDRSSPNRVMVISGNAGMGKSVISAVMCEKMQEAGRLAGSHFCQHDRARHRNPKVMLQSLASQLCDFLPDYKKAVVEKLSRNLGVEITSMEVKDLFEVLFEEPLTSLNDPGLTYLMVIDGLDESEFQGRNELLDVIANYFQSLPLWIRFLVTTRPEVNIAENLKNLHPLQLDPNIEENLEDIYLCFEKQLSSLLRFEHREDILQALVQKSEGVMLYAHYLIGFIKKEVPVLTTELLNSILPTGISSVYNSYFKRLESELCEELHVTEDQFLTFLSAVAAAREPLPLGFVSKFLLPGKSTSVVQRKVKAAIACVSALLPVQDECIHFFHKSVEDWLIDKSNYGQHHFSVAKEEGHEALSKLCINELDEVKRKGVDFAQFSDTTKYALRHGVQHMLQLEDARVCSLEEVVKKFVLDLELVYAKLCVNVTAASEDIVCVQKQAGVNEALLGKCERALNTLLVLLRKHSSALEELPQTIFQTLLNEGGTEFSCEALRLLETKYSEVAFMKYVYKEDLQEGVQTKFHCSDAVTCFDVSPQLDCMVCECEDCTIQLWSLHTGKLLWKRDASTMKYDYFYGCGPYRIPQNYFRRYCNDSLFDPPKSLYRSVVFHPTQDLILPGILSRGYTFDGELKPLFPSSKCRFWVCSISADKFRMLTDCPNDARSIVMWNLTDGSEINRFMWNADIMSFAWSLDGRLLAISDLSCCIGVLDVMDDFKTLLRVTLPEVCGMIKFSPDSRCLSCLAFTSAECCLSCFQVDLRNVCNFSCHSWELESCSETGYLLGDPFCLPPERDSLPWTPQLALVLNKQSLLRVSSGSHIIENLYVDKLTNNSPEDSNAVVEKVAFSLNGDILYVVTKKNWNLSTLLAWDISSAKLIAEKSDFDGGGFFLKWNLVTVRAGVLVQTSAGTLELWNFKLSECIRCWSDLGVIHVVIRLAEERVACEVMSALKEESACKVESKVIILDTTMEDIVSTVTFRGLFIACNSKCDVITASDAELQMQRGDFVIWKMLQPFTACGFLQCNTFSPSEQYCVLAGMAVTDNKAALYVLNPGSGITFRELCPCGDSRGLVPNYLNCKFVSDEECVTSINVGPARCCLRLFNVKSGDLLSAITTQNEVHSLAAYLPKCLIAVDFKDSFKVLQVKLPGDKHKKSKRSSLKSEKSTLQLVGISRRIR